MKIHNIPQYIKLMIQEKNRKYRIIPKMRKDLKNRDFSIISSTCNGCVLTSDLGVRFNSPTVNLSINPGDFLKFVSNLEYYLKCDICETKVQGISYPVGILGGEIFLFFVHYKTFQEAKDKWNQRKERINYHNLFFMMTDRDGCTKEQLYQFDSLPYKNKLVFTCKKYNDIQSAVWCKEYSQEKEVPVLSNYRNLKGERLYDRYFDFVHWLNEGEEKDVT